MPPSICTLFPFATIAAARVNKAAEPLYRVTKRVRTYNHLLGGRHGAFASKPARSSPRRLTAPSDLAGIGRTKLAFSDDIVTFRIASRRARRPGDQRRRPGRQSGVWDISGRRPSAAAPGYWPSGEWRGH